MARDLVPAAVGGLAALGTTLGIRAAVDPTDANSTKLFVWAPAIGAGVSLLAAGVVYMMGGSGPAAATGLVGGLASLGVFASDMVVGKKVGASAAFAAQYNPNPALHGLANLAAVVPEYSRQIAGILWEKPGMSGLGRNEQQSGEKVVLQGTVPGAFGTKSFAS
jgi:hypothetical protein